MSFYKVISVRKNNEQIKDLDVGINLNKCVIVHHDTLRMYKVL